MTENDDNLTAAFHLDQQEAQSEQEFWENTRRQEAITTLDQRQALTRRVLAQANLLEALNAVVWFAIAAGLIVTLVAAGRFVVGAFQ